MEFEWDERKRAQIIAERALDFVDAFMFFDGRPAIHQPTPRRGEDRWKTSGEKIRVITMRRAHEKEIATYRQLYGR